MRREACLALALAGLPACVTVRQADTLAGGGLTACETPRLLRPSAPPSPSPVSPDDEALLARYYSVRARAIAQAVGALPWLATVERLRDEGASRPAQLEARERFDELLLAVDLDLQDTLAQIGCERWRTNQALAIVLAEESAHNQTLTAISVVVTSAAAVVGGLLIPIQGTEWGQAVAAIAGGATGAALGGAQLLSSTVLNITGEENPLRDVWTLPSQPEVLSPAEVSFISTPLPGDPRGASLRDDLLRQWEGAGWLGTDGERARLVELYFGKGGVFTRIELLRRGRMLGDLETTVALMRPALQTLYTEVHRADHRLSP